MSGRRGFSAVELMVVLSVVAILTSIAVPSLVPAVQRAQVDAGAVAIADIARQARTLALAMPGHTGGDSYGVVVIQDATGRARAALTYGPDASPASIVADGAAEAAMAELPRSTVVYLAAGTGSSPSRDAAAAAAAATPLEGAIGWSYEPRTGVPMWNGHRAIGIGVARADATPTTRSGDVFQWPSPLADHLSVRSLSGAHAVELRVYGFGGIDRVERR